MSDRTDHRQRVRRVVLPGGKTIEVVSFEGPPGPRELHRCRACGSELVFPLDWSEASATHWRVTLRCPECEWTETGEFGQEAVERLDEVLDRGTEALVRDLRLVVQANMEEETDRFVAALAGGHILPADF